LADSVSAANSSVNTTGTATAGSLLSGSINFTGLGSGTDFNTIIDQLVKIESINKTRLETWKETWQSKIDSMRALNQRMTSIEEGAAAMDTAEEFNVRKATSSADSVATATTTNKAANGAYQVTVATNSKHILRSAGVASAAAVVVATGASTLRLTIGGVDHDVALAGGETLTGLMNAINAQAGTFVTASIEDDGTGSNAQHLVIKSATGGQAGNISVGRNPTSLSFDSKDMVVKSMTGWTGTATVGVLGQFTGSKADLQVNDYTFTVAGGGGTIGTDAFTINWASASRGTSGSISVPDTYVAGTQLAVESGLTIALAAGDMVNGQKFTADSNTMAIQYAAGWSGTSTVGAQGPYTGSKLYAQVDDYTFTVVGGATVGSGAFTLNWASSARGTSGTISVPADYALGTELAVEKGMNITLGAGTVINGQTFTVRAYANDIDDAETQSWAGAAITTAGNYLGSVSKTYNFTVMSNATLGGGTSVLRWTDSTGRTGTVSVAQANTEYAVDQGLKLKFAAGSLVSGNTFSVNVFAPDQQLGQDKGLAQVAKVVHGGFSDADSTAVSTGGGTFSYAYGGKSVTVNVSAGATLNSLIAAINADANNPGVTASVINDGLGLPTSFKLVLTGKNTGAQYQISGVSHTLDNLGQGGTLGGGFDLTQRATNSLAKIDGYPSGADTYLQRSTNQINDVVSGVSFTLADAGTAVVTVSTDTNSIYGKIEALVNAVNYAQSYIREATKYDSSTKEAGILVGNYAYYILKSRIDTALNTNISGLKDGTDTYVNLAQVGIHTDPDAEGVWTIDTATLMNALNSDPDAVANLFINNTTKGSKGAAKRMNDEMAALTDSSKGMLNVLINNYNGIIENIDKKIASEEKRLELYKQNLTERFARLETNLNTLNNQSKAIESAIAQLPSKNS
jgi:flagellar hook-associated protein 2